MFELKCTFIKFPNEFDFGELETKTLTIRPKNLDIDNLIAIELDTDTGECKAIFAKK